MRHMSIYKVGVSVLSSKPASYLRAISCCSSMIFVVSGTDSKES